MPNTLWCYRCHVYGHVTAVYRREIPRCGKCAGGHGTEECVVSVGKVVCVNYRGANVAGDRKCLVRERQVEVARVRVVQKISYAEAVKKAEEGGAKLRDSERIPVNSRSVPE